jgi:threonine dehydrogenase-like Zn-dependent dehydrogenase
MRAAAWQAPGALEVVDLPDPTAGLGQAVIAVDTCGICGSDLHMLHRGGGRPGLVLGHEFSGTVLEAPGVDDVQPGDRVTVRPVIPCGKCDRCAGGDIHLCENRGDQHIGFGAPGGFAERVLVPKAVVGETLFPLPEELSMLDGAMVEPLAVSLRAVRLAGVQPGQRVIVLGLGPIGLAIVMLLAASGARCVAGVDLSPLRRDVAARMGADVCIDPVAQDVVAVAQELTGTTASVGGARFDVSIECAGAPTALRDALRVVRSGGRVVLAAMYGRRVELSPDAVVGKELTVQGVFAYREEFPAVLEMLRSGEVQAGALVSHTYSLDDIQDAFATQSDPERSLKVVVRP